MAFWDIKWATDGSVEKDSIACQCRSRRTGELHLRLLARPLPLPPLHHLPTPLCHHRQTPPHHRQTLRRLLMPLQRVHYQTPVSFHPVYPHR